MSLLQKVETEEQKRRAGGREFQTVGAAKEKERLPSDVRILETTSRLEITILYIDACDG